MGFDDGSADAALPATTRMGAVTLAVDDLPALTAFYAEVLGLGIRGRGAGWVELGVATRPLVRLEASAGNGRDASGPGLYHLALLLPDRPALGAWLRFALERRIPLQGAADHAVSEAVYLADPEGNGIEVYRDRPRGRWAVSGATVAMTTEALAAADLLADAAPTWDGAPPGTRIGHVHLRVSELARSAAFYGPALGLARTNDAFPGALFLAAGGYHHHLGLNTWDRSRAAVAPRPPGAAGLRRFEIVVPEATARDAATDRLARAGAAVHRHADGFDVADPDGLEIRVRAPDGAT